MPRPDPTLSQLRLLLAKERECLRNADFDTLSSLVETKEYLLSDAQKSSKISERDLQDLKSMSERNQRLFASAMRGLREVSNRLGAIRQNQNGFSTYGRDGGRLKMAIGTRPTGTKI